MGFRDDFDRAWPVIKEAPITFGAVLSGCVAIGFVGASILYDRQLATAHEERDFWKERASVAQGPKPPVEQAGPSGKVIAPDGRPMLVGVKPENVPAPSSGGQAIVLKAVPSDVSASAAERRAIQRQTTHQPPRP